MRTTTPYDLKAWDLGTNAADQLCIGSMPVAEVARTLETPVHIVHGSAVRRTAHRFAESAASLLPGPASVHYAFKCNAVPGVVEMVREAGLRAEVMTPAELALARALGYAGGEIIVNGPSKTRAFLRQCLDDGVRFIIVDSLNELSRLSAIVDERGASCDILLRVNPDLIPAGMNDGSTTGSRTGCAFGLDLAGGEIEHAFALLRRQPRLHLAGFHTHLGTGIRNATEHIRAITVLSRLINEAELDGFTPSVVDLGGGFCSPTSREFTSREMLLYAALGRLPSAGSLGPRLEAFLEAIGSALRLSFGAHQPEIILEPGRSIVSAAQMLCVTVEYVKSRPGAGIWAITDGGLGTVSMPTYYEVHEVLPCAGTHRPRTTKMTLLGPGCFAGDVIYRNIWMPRLEEGEVLAIMDSGAYFTALESNFGHPRPAVVCVEDGDTRLLRRRETIDEMFSRDPLLTHALEVIS